MNGDGNQNESLAWLTYQETMTIRRAIIARHREYIERRLKQNMPTKLLLSIAFSLILIGLVELALQIVLIVESGPLYYIAHGIWGALVSFMFAAVCLLLCKLLTFLFFSSSLQKSIIKYIIF